MARQTETDITPLPATSLVLKSGILCLALSECGFLKSRKEWWPNVGL